MKIDLDADSVPNRLARKISQSIAQRPMAFFSASEKDLLCIDLERHRSGNRTRRRRCFLPTTHNSAENDAWRLRRRNQNRPTATENILSMRSGGMLLSVNFRSFGIFFIAEITVGPYR